MTKNEPAAGLAGTTLSEWGVGEVEASKSTGAGAAPWVFGGIIVLLAVTAYAIETKGPAPLRR